MHIVDVWESREAYDRYAAEKIGPYSAEVGITEPPEMRFYDVYSHLGRGLDAS
jgi:hypothetical protein